MTGPSKKVVDQVRGYFQALEHLEAEWTELHRHARAALTLNAPDGTKFVGIGGDVMSTNSSEAYDFSNLIIDNALYFLAMRLLGRKKQSLTPSGTWRSNGFSICRFDEARRSSAQGHTTS